MKAHLNRDICTPGIGIHQSEDAIKRQALRVAVETTVHARLGVSSDHIRGTARGRRHVVFARHLSLYLAQSVSGANLTAIARLFDYDRQVVSYAMRRIEEQRDDARWDRVIELLTAEAGRTFEGFCRRLEAGVAPSRSPCAGVARE